MELPSDVQGCDSGRARLRTLPGEGRLCEANALSYIENCPGHCVAPSDHHDLAGYAIVDYSGAFEVIRDGIWPIRVSARQVVCIRIEKPAQPAPGPAMKT